MLEKSESSYTVSGNVTWYNHSGEQYGGSLKNLGIQLPYDLAIPIWGVYSEILSFWAEILCFVQ